MEKLVRKINHYPSMLEIKTKLNCANLLSNPCDKTNVRVKSNFLILIFFNEPKIVYGFNTTSRKLPNSLSRSNGEHFVAAAAKNQAAFHNGSRLTLKKWNDKNARMWFREKWPQCWTLAIKQLLIFRFFKV